MNWRSLLFLVVALTALTGCNVSVRPATFPGGAIGVKFKGTGDIWDWLNGFLKSPDSPATSLIGASLVAQDLDAAQVSFDFAGTTIALPQNSIAIVQLVYSGSDVVRTQAQFSVTRSGSVFKFTNPAAVNDWVLSAAQQGDEIQVSYDVPDTSVNGENTMSVATVAAGVTVATASSTWLTGGTGGCSLCQEK
jgi:hypothetical protein